MDAAHNAGKTLARKADGKAAAREFWIEHSKEDSTRRLNLPRRERARLARERGEPTPTPIAKGSERPSAAVLWIDLDDSAMFQKYQEQCLLQRFLNSAVYEWSDDDRRLQWHILLTSTDDIVCERTFRKCKPFNVKQVCNSGCETV